MDEMEVIANPSTPARSSGREASARLLAAAVVSRSLRAVRGFVLARLLVPEVFGGYALIGALVGPLASLANIGLTPLVAREREPDEPLVATAAWVARATSWAALVALAAGVTLWAAGTSRLALLGPGLAVAAATALYLAPQVDIGILQQRRRFSQLAKMDVSFDVVWTVVSISLALMLRSVWALAGAELAAQLTRALIARAAARPRPAARRHRNVLPRIVRFSGASTAGTFLWATVFALPAWLLQRHVDFGGIGQFTLAYTYSQLGALMLGGIAARVSLPAVAGAARERRVEEAWRYAEGLSLVLAPMTALVAVAGPPALVALVGARWQAAATLLFPLAWGMAARVAFPFGVLAQVDGRPGLDGYLAAATLTAYAIAEFAVGWTSPARAALVVAGVDVAVAVAAMALARRLWGSTRGAWRPVAQLWGGSCLGAAAAATVPLGQGSWVAAVERGAAFVVAYSAWTVAFAAPRRRYLAEIRSTFASLRARFVRSR